jgi:hypothetical protein
MAYIIQEYEYEGTAEVLCEDCDTVHEIEFTGSDQEYKSIKDAIKEALITMGWRKNKCPSCVEEDGDDGDIDE